MSARKCVACVVLAIAVIFTVKNAYPNGHHLPQLTDTVVVKTICKERLGSREYEIFRTLVESGPNRVKFLTFNIRGVEKRINIPEIKILTISAGTVDSDGFVEGALIRSDGTEEKAVKVQVKIKNTSIYLTGFRENGTRLRIDLTKCKSIEFSSVITPDESYGGGL